MNFTTKCVLSLPLIIHVAFPVVAADYKRPTPAESYGEALRLTSKQNQYRDLARAKEILESNHAIGHHISSLLLSRLYVNDEAEFKDPEKSLTILREISPAGYAVIDVEIGDRYLNGLGVAQSDGTALQYYKKAALKNAQFVIDISNQPLSSANSSHRQQLLYKAAVGLLKTENDQNKGFQRILEEGIELYNAKQYSDCIKKLQNLADTEILSVPDSALYVANAFMKQDEKNGWRRASKYFKAYFDACDQLSLPKNAEALYEYGMLALKGRQSGTDPKTAKQYFDEAHNLGHQDATIPLAKILIFQEKAKEAFSAGVQLLLGAVSHKEADIQLGLAYLRRRFPIDDKNGTRVLNGLIQIAKNDPSNSYLATKECLLWLADDKPALAQQFNEIEQKLAHKHEKRINAAISPRDMRNFLRALALYHVKSGEPIKAYEHFARIGNNDDDADAIVIEARLYLVYGWVKWAFAPLITDLTRWLKTYVEHRPNIPKELDLLNHELAKVLAEAGDVTVATKVFEEILPLSKVTLAKELIDKGELPSISADENTTNIASVIAGAYSGRNPRFEKNTARFGAYLAYLASAGNHHAIIKVGTLLLIGKEGFLKNPNLALKVLSTIPEQSSVYPEALISIGAYFLSENNYEEATEMLIRSCKSTHFTVQNLAKLALLLQGMPDHSLTINLCDAVISLSDKFPKNPHIYSAKVHKAVILSAQQMPHDEISQTLDQCKNPYSRIIRADIMLKQKNYDQASELLRQCINDPEISDDNRPALRLHYGYVLLFLGKYEAAFESFRKAAREKNIRAANFNIALMHFLGIITTYDRMEAIRRLCMAGADKPVSSLTEVLAERAAIKPFLFETLKRTGARYYDAALKLKEFVVGFAKENTLVKYTPEDEFVSIKLDLQPIIKAGLEQLSQEKQKIDEMLEKNNDAKMKKEQEGILKDILAAANLLKTII